MVNFLKVMKKSTSLFLFFIVFLGVQTLNINAYGQTNRKGQKHSFSTMGRNHTFIRHGLTIHLGSGISARLKQSVSAVPMGGIGYVASQYYGVGNRFMQQSITYQFGLGLSDGGYQTHNVVGTFHCSYIGKLDLNPFIYGIALQFIYATESKISPSYSNFYVRPEIGIAFPAQYKDRTKSIQRVTAMITYGFNIRTFYNFNPDMDKFKTSANLQQTTAKEDVIYPWTAMNHHVVTVRLNINLGNIREFRRQ